MLLPQSNQDKETSQALDFTAQFASFAVESNIELHRSVRKNLTDAYVHIKAVLGNAWKVQIQSRGTENTCVEVTKEQEILVLVGAATKDNLSAIYMVKFNQEGEVVAATQQVVDQRDYFSAKNEVVSNPLDREKLALGLVDFVNVNTSEPYDINHQNIIYWMKFLDKEAIKTHVPRHG